MSAPKVFRTTIRLNALSLSQLTAIQSITRLNTTQVIGNALAIYADRVQRESNDRVAKARREGEE